MVAQTRKPTRLREVPIPTAESQAIDNHAQAMHEVGVALKAVAEAIDAARIAGTPQHDFFKRADSVLECAGTKIKKWTPWALASIPLIVSLINGFSPQAAKFIQFAVSAIQSAPQ